MDTVLPAILDLVHRIVGGVDEAVGRGGDVGKRRDANRDGETEIQAFFGQKLVLGDALPNALADGVHALAASIGERIGSA